MAHTVKPTDQINPTRGHI